MAKYRDKRRARSPSSLCKFRTNETAKMRHDRRFETANSQQSINALRGWCEAHGLYLDIDNYGEHWCIRRRHRMMPRSMWKVVAHWWPRSAKLVIHRRFRDGIHAHDVGQVIDELKTELETDA